jgi:hypothetical protein
MSSEMPTSVESSHSLTFKMASSNPFAEYLLSPTTEDNSCEEATQALSSCSQEKRNSFLMDHSAPEVSEYMEYTLYVGVFWALLTCLSVLYTRLNGALWKRSLAVPATYATMMPGAGSARGKTTGSLRARIGSPRRQTTLTRGGSPRLRAGFARASGWGCSPERPSTEGEETSARDPRCTGTWLQFL